MSFIIVSFGVCPKYTNNKKTEQKILRFFNTDIQIPFHQVSFLCLYLTTTFFVTKLRPSTDNTWTI